MFEQREMIMLTSLLKNRFNILNVKYFYPVTEAGNHKSGKRVGLLGRLFRCRHEKLSRPFSQNNIAYLSCLTCGAKKPFDTEKLQPFGKFYY